MFADVTVKLVECVTLPPRWTSLGDELVEEHTVEEAGHELAVLCNRIVIRIIMLFTLHVIRIIMIFPLQSLIIR